MATQSCNDPSGIDLSVEVTAPPPEGATADESYIVEWVVSSDEWPEARVDLYVDRDLDPSAGLIQIAESLKVAQTGFNWVCRDFPEGDYFVRATVFQGSHEESDYSDGVISVAHAKTVVNRWGSAI
jgi:hypothetical protein